MAGTKKEEIESKNAVAKVTETEAKVKELEAKKLADKAKKHEERLEKHPKMGKVDNAIADNWKKGVAFVLTGGVSFVAGWGAKKFSDKRKADKAAAEAIDITPESESTEPPFEA